ncbi:MAG: LytR C-terminal domain-containing protein [Gemmatimonadaceae bacterium]
MEPRSAKRLVVAGLVVAGLAAGAVYWVRHRAALPAVPISSPAMRAPVGVRITVEVLNSTSVRGLARRATMVLRDAGFDVVRYSNEPVQRDSTRVIARSGHLEWAQAVARALGATRVIVESRPDSLRYLDVSVLLGTDWRPPAQPFYP